MDSGLRKNDKSFWFLFFCHSSEGWNPFLGKVTQKQTCNTEKRIQAIKGTIIFDSEIDKGFKAEIKIPC
ncbi:hypothetical protein [uncultured Aquimarina sp.]|uniref:hypothetical protein n=1 Tax=uncultured Aquimarina sp. TaxID=575652 RepID=UPI0026091138|nr:hypothetical protein [uncultured Aquimarina sp.]